MGPDRGQVGEDAQEVILNFGCGYKKLIGGINVDAFEVCNPDVVWDLNKVPLPWEDNSVDYIMAQHIFEHLNADTWWDTFADCARILKPGGMIEIRVPDESSTSAGTYRDHNHILSMFSFHGTHGTTVPQARGTNAWASQVNEVPLKLARYEIVPFEKYMWMTRWCRWLLKFCNNHMRNFIWEQAFYFKKIGGENG